MRDSHPGEFGCAHIEALQAQGAHVEMLRRVVAARFGEAGDLHLRAPYSERPVSILNLPLGSMMATNRTIQPSPFFQRQGKAANVTRLPVTLSMSPPMFSKPQMPADRIALWHGSHSGKSSITRRPVNWKYSSLILGNNPWGAPGPCGPIAVPRG